MTGQKTVGLAVDGYFRSAKLQATLELVGHHVLQTLRAYRLRMWLLAVIWAWIIGIS